MNTQEAFNKMTHHLLTQKAPSTLRDYSTTCAYRGPRGLMCAVGCLIPDDQYDPDYERRRVSSFHADVPAIADLPLDFLLMMQTVHDSFEPDEWFEQLARVADHYTLTMETSHGN